MVSVSGVEITKLWNSLCSAGLFFTSILPCPGAMCFFFFKCEATILRETCRPNYPPSHPTSKCPIPARARFV